jgi:hypothetical protein
MRTTSPGSGTATGAEQGTGHRIRAIAPDANIDPSKVMRYFGNKDKLFGAAEFDLEFQDLSTIDETELGARPGQPLRESLGARRSTDRVIAHQR